MENLVIVGTSTAANTVYKFVNKYNLYNVLGFAVNSKYKNHETYLGKPVFELEKLNEILDKERDNLFIAIQWNRLNADRRHVYESLKQEGYKFANLVSPNTSINSKLNGDNCWITDYVCIETDVVIGSNVFVKVGAWIGEQSEISNHCFIGAKSTIGGGVKVGEQSFIGLGAIVFDNTVVGKKCIVGAATALKRNLPDNSVYKTITDTFLTKTYNDDEIESKLLFKKNIR